MGKKEKQYLTLSKSHLLISYFFMAADGEISPKELEYFDEIGKCYEGFKTEKDNIINYCKKVLEAGYEPFEAIKKTVKSETINVKDSPITAFEVFTHMFHFSHLPSKENASLLWLLINLGYVDGDYSEPERNIVSFISKQCKFPDDLILEFEDIAKTLNVLESYHQELPKQAFSYSYAKKVLFFKIKKTHQGRPMKEIEEEIVDIENDKQKITESLFALINEWE